MSKSIFSAEGMAFSISGNETVIKFPSLSLKEGSSIIIPSRTKFFPSIRLLILFLDNR